MLRPFANFLEEAVLISHVNAQNNALSIYIEGQKDESIAMWQVIKHTASLQEAMKESNFMQEHHEIRLKAITTYAGIGSLDDVATLDWRFLLLCSLPDRFYQAVRDITLGTSFVHFEGDAGMLWDVEGEIGKEGPGLYNS